MNEKRGWCLSFQLQASLCWQVLHLLTTVFLWNLIFYQASSQDNVLCHAIFFKHLVSFALYCHKISIYVFLSLFINSISSFCFSFRYYFVKNLQILSQVMSVFLCLFYWQIILYIFVLCIMVICCMFKICNNQIKVINISLSLPIIFNVLGFDRFFSCYLKCIIDCFNCYLNMIFSPLCVLVPLNLTIIPLPFLVSNDYLSFPSCFYMWEHNYICLLYTLFI